MVKALKRYRGVHARGRCRRGPGGRYRLARALALATLRDASVTLDVPAVQDALDEIRRMVGEVQGAKVRLTSIATAAGEVSKWLDGMRAGVLRAVGDIEAQLSVMADASVEAQSA